MRAIPFTRLAPPAAPWLAAALLALAAASAAWAQTGRLNDTGQTSCYTHADCRLTQEDGRHGRDPAQAAGALAKVGGGAAGFDFTRICWNGQAEGSAGCTGTLVANTGGAAASPATPTNWACTRDNLTGLMWSLQTVASITWNDAMDTSTAGRPIPATNTAARCGFTDWRLPSRRELLSIVHHGTHNPAIDGAYFPDTASAWYWSRDTYAPNAAFAWFVDFGSGDANASYKASSYQVRLVRSGQSFASFDAAAQALTVAVSGGGAVSAGASPVPTAGGIAGCSSASGAACAASYTHTSPAAEVTLTASALPGSSFTGWGGACGGSASTCFVIMNQARHVMAEFALKTYTVSGSADPAEGGSVTCPPDPVTHGNSAICTVSAKPGYTLGAVTSSCGGSLNGNSFTTGQVTADCSVSASFSLNSYTIATSATPAAGGSVSCTPSSVTHGGSSTCTATANTGYSFHAFSGCDSTSANVCTLGEVRSERSVSAHFKINQTITLTAPNTQAFSPGGSFTVTASASSGLPVDLQSSTPTICTVSASTVSLVKAGTCTLVAQQDGDANTNPAPQVTRNIAIGLAPQKLSFLAQSPASHTFAKDGRFAIQPLASSAEPNSHQPITYSSLTADICTVAGTEVSMLAPGNCTIAADQAGDHNYAAAAQVTQSVALNAQQSFSGTTVPSDPSDAGSATASFSGGGDACRFDLDQDATAFIAAPAPPEGKTLPQGMFSFKLIGCEPGSTITMRIAWPQAVSGYTKHGKESASAAASSYFEPSGLAIDGHSVSFTVQDGQKGDDDWSENGQIVDPSGPLADAAPPPVAQVTPIPTLGEWGLMLLGLLAAGLGVHRLRRG